MRQLLILLKRELMAYFYSPVAYIVLCFFLLASGFDIYSSVSVLNRGPQEVTLVEVFFTSIVFWFAMLLLVPLITMRLYSEEFKLGTIETLMTAPVNDWQVVAAKFLGAFVFYLVLWAPTAQYFSFFNWLTGQQDVQSQGALWGSYLLIAVLGAFYISIGCLASVLTRNQIVAAIISTVTVILFFFTGFLGYLLPNVSQGFQDFVAYFSTFMHMRDYNHGIIDTRPLVFYLSMTLLLQVVTFQVFQYRKWKF